MKLLTFVLTILAAADLSAQAYRRGQTEPTYTVHYIKLQEGRDLEIPALADGMLTTLSVREGQRIAGGLLMATIDDREAQAAVEVQVQSLKAAEQRAEDQVELLYAQASYDTAEATVKMDIEANLKKPNTVSEVEMMRNKLDLRRTELQIEKAEKDKELALLDANVKQAELDAARAALSKRQISAPWDGEVLKIYVQQHEWVRAGDPILRLANFETLDVECLVPADEYRPSQVANRRVTVRIQLTGRPEATIEGRVVYVKQELNTQGQFMVRAEIPNQRDGDFWLIQPGQNAEMTIHVNQPPVATAALSQPAAR